MNPTTNRLRILWVKSGPLHPPDTGGRKRTHSMLVELSRSHEVTYLALHDERVALEPGEAEAGYAARKVWVPWREAAAGTAKWCAELAWNLACSSLPYALAKYRSRMLEQSMLRLCREEPFDLVVCDFLAPAVNFLRVRGRLGAPAVLFQHNIEAQIWRRLAAGKRNSLARWYFGVQARRMAAWERRLSRLFNGVITVSADDAELARRDYALANVLGEVPTGVDAEYFRPAGDGPDGPPTIGFLGSMDWMPNIEAVQWFVRDIFPAIRAAVPAVRLLVIGRRPPAAIAALAASDPGIEVTGTVADVRPHLRRCHLLAVPLLSGGGTRIKIMEALAAGLPVVSTTTGAEGLGLVDGVHVMIADTAAEFAAAATNMLGDHRLRLRLGAAGRELVLAECSWARAAAVFIGHCGKLGIRLASGAEPRHNRGAC